MIECATSVILLQFRFSESARSRMWHGSLRIGTVRVQSMRRKLLHCHVLCYLHPRSCPLQTSTKRNSFTWSFEPADRQKLKHFPLFSFFLANRLFLSSFFRAFASFLNLFRFRLLALTYKHCHTHGARAVRLARGESADPCPIRAFASTDDPDAADQRRSCFKTCLLTNVRVARISVHDIWRIELPPFDLLRSIRGRIRTCFASAISSIRSAKLGTKPRKQ